MRGLPTVMVFVAVLPAIVTAQTLTATGSFDLTAVMGSNQQHWSGPLLPGNQILAPENGSWTLAAGRGEIQTTRGTVSVGCTAFCQFPSCSIRAQAVGTGVFTFSAPTLMGGEIWGRILARNSSIDIGDDGVPEPVLQPGLYIPYPVVIGPSGLRVRLSAWASLSAVGDIAELAEATFYSNYTAALQPYGPTCGIELLAALAVDHGAGTHIATLECAGAPNTPFAFLILGLTQLDVPIPPTNCRLLTDLVIAIPLAITNGRASTRIVVPYIPHLTFLGQVIVSDSPPPNVSWRTSNGVRVTVR